MSSPLALLRARRFGPLFLTQFLGAFNDNLYKNALVVLLTFQAAQWTSLSIGLLANLAAGIFILPFFLFSATAGQLADKYDKACLARWTKLLEIVVVLLAGAGFWAHSLALLLAALCLLGLQSTLFGPVKYAILPQHLHEDELVGGNALIEAGTFVAILIGTLAGGLLAAQDASPLWISAACLLVALAGWLGSLRIPSAPAPEPQLRINPNPFAETWRNIGFAREERSVFLAILGISWFWLYGALLLAQFPAYAKDVLGAGESGVTLLLAVFTLGIGVGSMLCERLSGPRVEIGLVPLGSLGLSLFGLDLAAASPAVAPSGPLGLVALLQAPGSLHVLGDLFALGLFGGFFIVPLYALMQLRSAPAHRARIVAANNILNALFMVFGAGAAAGLLAAGLSIPALIGVAALGNALVALYIYRLVPEFVLRFLAWLLVHALYRLETRGFERIPESGPALLVGTRVSQIDALLLAAASHRPLHCIAAPAASHLLAGLQQSTGAIAAPQLDSALAAGGLVALLADGDETAELHRRLAGQPVPVLPLRLAGLEDSPFTCAPRPLLARLLALRPRQRIVLQVGAALADEAAAAQALRALGDAS